MHETRLCGDCHGGGGGAPTHRVQRQHGFQWFEHQHNADVVLLDRWIRRQRDTGARCGRGHPGLAGMDLPHAGSRLRVVRRDV